MKLLHRLSALAMTAVMAFSFSGGVSAADADTATIDTGRSTSLTLYKYDLTGAENDGVWDAESYVSTGLADEQVNTALSQYAIQGVEFFYVKLADLNIYKGTAADGHQETVPLYAFTENTKTGSRETIDFLSALGLSTNDAYRTDHDGKQNRVWYFKSDVLIEALDHALTANSTSTKDALEKYMAANGGTAMPETDENGYSKVDGLAQGLYLLVETRVPENVTSTTAPFLVSLPMTTVDGSAWNYDLTLYPKNETGNPTLEKTVRESKSDTGKNAGKTDDITDGYNHTATASDGDVVEYQVISTLPTITSPATALTTYTFVDDLSKGIQYNKNDVQIEFFKDAACTDQVAVWTEQDGKFTASYTDYSSESGSSMTIAMTSDGLAEINAATTVYDPATSLFRGYSNLTMRITYACTVNSDATMEEADEMTMSYAEIKALTTGNPLIKEKMDLDVAVSRLTLLRSSFLSQRYNLENKLQRYFPAELQMLEQKIQSLTDDLQQVEETATAEPGTFSPMELDGVTYTEKKPAGAAILAACERKTTVEEAPLGSYRGFSMGLAFEPFQKEFQIILRRQLSYPVSLGNDALGNLQRIDNLLDGLEGRLTNAKRQLETTQEEMRTAKQEAEKEFPKEQELREKAARLQELNSLLNMDERDNTVLDDNEVESETLEYSCVR